MISLKRNIAANYIGQGWSAIMGLAFIPVYVKYLGVEAYGLIGLVALVQAWIALLDVGMTPTLNREMARYSAGVHSKQEVRDLLRSLEILCFGIAAIIGFGVWTTSGYLAAHWLKAEKLSIPVVAHAISIIAFVVALRFIEGIYRGSLFGLQRQILYNVIAAILATVRHGGAVAILIWVSATVPAFFVWQAIASLLSVFVLALTVHRILPDGPSAPRFSLQALVGIRRFAAGMMGITFLTILLTQVDKVLLSRMLTLESFGYYTLAATVAGVLYNVIVPISQAIYPRLVELVSRNDDVAVVSVYHVSSQLVTILTAPAVMLLCFFASGVVFVWSGKIELAANTAAILSPLVLGTFLNALMHIPYQLQLAHGWTGLSIKANIVAVALLVPAMFWIVPRYGAVGAAWIWVVLNAGYAIIAVQFMHRRLIPAAKWEWYLSDVLLPVFGSLAVMVLAEQVKPVTYESRLQWLGFLLFTGVTALIASGALASRIRGRVMTALRSRLGRAQS